MKKVMQNKSLLHRLIALTMAVVMTLTLVASGLVLSAGMILISLIGGLMYFDRKDIL